MGTLWVLGGEAGSVGSPCTPTWQQPSLKGGVDSREPADPGDQARAVAAHLPVIRITWGFGKKQVLQRRCGFLRCGPGGAAVKSGPRHLSPKALPSQPRTPWSAEEVEEWPQQFLPTPPLGMIAWTASWAGFNKNSQHGLRAHHLPRVALGSSE